jgi:hypothetical protein
MLEDTVEELLEEGPGEITIEVEEETSPGIQLESLPESLMEEIPGILATPSPLLNNPSRESLSPSEFLPSGSEQITLEIHLDLSSLPEALRNSLKPFLSGDLQIPMSIQISPKKEK